MKNLLVVAGAVIAVIIVAIVVIWFTKPGLLGLGSSDQASTAGTSTPPAPPVAPPPSAVTRRPPKMASATAGPALKNKAGKANSKVAAKPKQAAKAQAKVAKVGPAAATKPGAVKVASLVGAPSKARPDPFVIPGVRYEAPPKPSVTTIAATPIVTNWEPPVIKAPPPPVTPTTGPAELPNDRVAGIMLNNGVYAIMDADGESQVVQPGDTLPGGEKVVSIQSDSVTLRTTDNQSVNLPLSAGASSPNMGYPGGMPASYNGGGPPPYQMDGRGAP
jgi:hypothetical protein